jgi:pyrroline-5-carboxylate reductase
MSLPPPQKLGVVGYGTIAHSIAAGLLSQPAFEVASVHVSRRSAAKSAAIKARHPSKVTVCDDNQAVVDAADLVFLCVLPGMYEEVLAGLEFGERHTLVSLVSTSTLARLQECSRLPAERAFKMICLPSVATRDGTCLLVPPSPPLKAVLDTLGGCVCCATEKIMTTMMIPACLMGPYYRVLQQNRDWMVANGVPEEDASYFVGRT